MNVKLHILLQSYDLLIQRFDSDLQLAGSLAFPGHVHFFSVIISFMVHFCSCRCVVTLFGSMGFSIKFDAIKSGWSIVYIEGSQKVCKNNRESRLRSVQKIVSHVF